MSYVIILPLMISVLIYVLFDCAALMISVLISVLCDYYTAPYDFCVDLCFI